jgi:hypothetical protein
VFGVPILLCCALGEELVTRGDGMKPDMRADRDRAGIVIVCVCLCDTVTILSVFVWVFPLSLRGDLVQQLDTGGD